MSQPPLCSLAGDDFSIEDLAAFTPAAYVRDNMLGLAALVLSLVSLVLILPALGVNSSGVLLVADILTLLAVGAGFLDYRRKAAFYHELRGLLASLRQARVPSLHRAVDPRDEDAHCRDKAHARQ